MNENFDDEWVGRADEARRHIIKLQKDRWHDGTVVWGNDDIDNVFSHCETDEEVLSTFAAYRVVGANDNDWPLQERLDWLDDMLEDDDDLDNYPDIVRARDVVKRTLKAIGRIKAERVAAELEAVRSLHRTSQLYADYDEKAGF